MKDTPRTNAASMAASGGTEPTNLVRTDFARQLEREVNTLNAKLGVVAQAAKVLLSIPAMKEVLGKEHGMFCKCPYCACEQAVNSSLSDF